MTPYPLPKLGEIVHFYDPKIVGKVGWNTGFRGRGNGPYLATVTNEKTAGDFGKVDLAIFMPQAGGGVMFVVDVPFNPINEEGLVSSDIPRDSSYWDFADSLAKGRAVKRMQEQAKADAEAAAEAALA